MDASFCRVLRSRQSVQAAEGALSVSGRRGARGRRAALTSRVGAESDEPAQALRKGALHLFEDVA